VRHPLSGGRKKVVLAREQEGDTGRGTGKGGGRSRTGLERETALAHTTPKGEGLLF